MWSNCDLSSTCAPASLPCLVTIAANLLTIEILARDIYETLVDLLTMQATSMRCRFQCGRNIHNTWPIGTEANRHRRCCRQLNLAFTIERNRSNSWLEAHNIIHCQLPMLRDADPGDQARSQRDQYLGTTSTQHDVHTPSLTPPIAAVPGCATDCREADSRWTHPRHSNPPHTRPTPISPPTSQ